MIRKRSLVSAWLSINRTSLTSPTRSKQLAAPQSVMIFSFFIKFIGSTNNQFYMQILVTSLTRRGFQGGKVVENLAEPRTLTIEAADEVGAQYLDLNRASTDYV